MSKDASYLLNYESQMYLEPTPMELDMNHILEKDPEASIKEMYSGFVLFVEMSKWSLGQETIDNLKADQIFVKYDGDMFERVR